MRCGTVRWRRPWDKKSFSTNLEEGRHGDGEKDRIFPSLGGSLRAPCSSRHLRRGVGERPDAASRSALPGVWTGRCRGGHYLDRGSPKRRHRLPDYRPETACRTGVPGGDRARLGAGTRSPPGILAKAPSIAMYSRFVTEASFTAKHKGVAELSSQRPTCSAPRGSEDTCEALLHWGARVVVMASHAEGSGQQQQ